ncbi:MAG: hypothetical protein A2845_00455 [Candidatus Lloydbacteria bacterium RIFCSPHIGHO2_01_FULL_49_22]|uniref:Uncharacterized protein n=1 Tax=Candidatus Lloydbacteria bacterium RIFCSPHIGHO2_01_FULL_49_22 TaxID=1798658 RepID=A0A1G2CY04_9BACT|nr:MAG: hypothetical protein A2845_00455 [Candidatus Lloydbacteria bacterium RIFCSPHIGHO2_01_FULL_49_22]OGZ09334.1 MAG: hypothetical protein A3C14_05360 [Candidatus Lloydbacteria bacterium RIFCSPHIGHO2_02_FULL_50_18]
MKKNFARISFSRGGILIQVIAFMSIGMVILSGFVGWGIMSSRVARHTEAREQVFEIAESGIDYYRWHLAHADTDYQDGTGVAGPYVHDFNDKNGVKIGTFTLDITAPPTGSTLVVVKSTGALLSDPTMTRTIQAKFAKPSFAKYALVTDSDVWEDAVEIFGPYHSNGGVHFSNVVAHNVVTSAQRNYIDPDFGGNRWGVYTSKSIVGYPTGDPNYPSAYPVRNDVFVAGRTISVPAVDFAGMMSDLSTIRTNAQTSGRYYAPSGAFGYHIKLKNTDKFDIWTVTAKTPSPNGSCKSNYLSQDTHGGMWSISAETVLASNVDVPTNGLIFTEDDVWVEGLIDTARVTVAAARFPDNAANRASIIVNNDLLYTSTTTGTDVIGLIAQGYLRVGYASADDLEIDAALIAQSGAIWRDFYYQPNCGASSKRTKITTFGSLISNQRYTFSWSCGASCTSGYATQVSNYDVNLLYAPPPSFPLTTDKYQVLSWDEI